LPVLDVIGELGELDFDSKVLSTYAAYLNFTFQLDLNIVQEAQVELLANHVGLALLQEQTASVVSMLDAPEEIVGDIVLVIL
jgi:hypothetical protein